LLYDRYFSFLLLHFVILLFASSTPHRIYSHLSRFTMYHGHGHGHGHHHGGRNVVVVGGRRPGVGAPLVAGAMVGMAVGAAAASSRPPPSTTVVCPSHHHHHHRLPLNCLVTNTYSCSQNVVDCTRPTYIPACICSIVSSASVNNHCLHHLAKPKRRMLLYHLVSKQLLCKPQTCC
jgi:hypothetical protein